MLQLDLVGSTLLGFCVRKRQCATLSSTRNYTYCLVHNKRCTASLFMGQTSCVSALLYLLALHGSHTGLLHAAVLPWGPGTTATCSWCCHPLLLHGVALSPFVKGISQGSKQQLV
jgi:hypothetical protein